MRRARSAREIQRKKWPRRKISWAHCLRGPRMAVNLSPRACSLSMQSRHDRHLEESFQHHTTFVMAQRFDTT
jgi:hypothetical protein